MSRTTIPKKLRQEMSTDPFYKLCALSGYLDHICGGSITWEHTIIYAGKSLQKKWSIIPLCEKAHAVNNFQDAGTMRKDVNIWIALNRANDQELLEISKVERYIYKRSMLNLLYGPWSPPKIKNEVESIGGSKPAIANPVDYQGAHINH